jgi:recombination protein RecA
MGVSNTITADTSLDTGHEFSILGDVAAVVPLSSARALSDEALRPAPLSLAERVNPGRLSELSGGRSCGRTTLAVSLMIQAQLDDEPVAWVQLEDGSLYPPDLADSGIDLDALVVLRIPRRAGAHGLSKAAEMLLRSGAFGLVVVDLTAGAPRGDAWQSRLSAMARKHGSRVILLSDGDDSVSLGSMVALRVTPERERRAPGRFAVEQRIMKDKLGGGALAAERRRAPWGLP